MTEISDEAIAAEVQEGSTEAFGMLVDRYEAKLLRYARKFLFGYHDAEDLVQDVFLKAYTNIQSYNPHRRFSPWIYRIAHNVFINAIKRKHREPVPFFDPDTLFPHPIAKERPDDEILSRELKDFFEKSLGELDPKYREPVVLYFFEEMEYREIAEVLQIPVSTVGVRIKRAKAKLKKKFISNQ